MTRRDLLELLRIPNVFTAVADPLAGWLMTGALLHPRLLALVPAAAGLYLGGMVLNDFFDRETDARERPGRPIPSGRVTPGFAALLGFGLLGLGLLCAAVAGLASLAVAGALALCVLGYDGAFGGDMRRGLLGPLLMGGCRGLNLLMGAVAAAGSFEALFDLALAMPGVLVAPALYTAWTTNVTLLSRGEAGAEGEAVAPGLTPERVLLAQLVVLALAAAAMGPPTFPSRWGLLCVLAALARLAWLVRAVGPAPRGPAVGRLIGGSILLMPVLGAGWVAAAGRVAEAGALCLLIVPALWLKRRYYMT